MTDSMIKVLYTFTRYGALLHILCLAVSSAELQSNSCNSRDFKFSIISRQNLTGHWIAEVEMEHKGEHTGKKPWELDIDQTTGKCGDCESIRILVTITAPPNCDYKKKPSADDKHCISGVEYNKPPADYKQFPGLNYYKFHTDETVWEKARKICEEEGAHLAVINSEAEAQALTKLWITLYSDWRKDWALIGTWDVYRKGQFLTIFNETLDYAGYNKWSSGEPDYPGVQNYGALRINGVLGNVYDNTVLPFICEFE